MGKNLYAVNEVGLLTLSPEDRTGFDSVAGPYPDWDMPNKARWMVSHNASMEFVGHDKGHDHYSLKMRVLTMAAPHFLYVALNEERC